MIIQLLMLVLVFAITSEQLLAVNRGRFSKPVFKEDKDTPFGLHDETGEPLMADDLVARQGTFGLTHGNCNPTNWSRSVPTSQTTWTILGDCIELENTCKGAWISADLKYTTGKDRAGPPLPSLLSDKGPLYSQVQISESVKLAQNGPVNDFAFFTDPSAPFIIIDLGSMKKTDKMYILATRNPKHWANLQGLKISLCQNGKKYEEVWKHKPVTPRKLSFGDTYCNIPDINASWELQPARYIKLEIPAGQGGLGLRRVFIYNSTAKKTLSSNVERNPRIWTSTSGATINASLVKESGRFVVLKGLDGSPIKIPVTKLSKADRAHIEKLRNEE
jgi:hypothetical protein